jgi:hypothetical protein
MAGEDGAGSTLVVMDGTLATTAPADALRLLARDGETGTLHLDTPYGRARVVVDDGRIVGAWSPTQGARLGERLVGAGSLERADLQQVLARQDDPSSPRLGALLVEERLVSHDAVRLFVQEQILDALFEIVGWRAGTYVFEQGRPSSPPEEITVAIPIAAALTEVDRRRREWHRLQELVPSLGAIPRAADSSTHFGALESDEATVLAHVDGRRSIRDLAVDLGFGPFETARIVYGLATANLVDVTLPATDDEADGAPTQTVTPQTPAGAEATTGDEPVSDGAEAPPGGRTPTTTGTADTHAQAGQGAPTASQPPDPEAPGAALPGTPVAGDGNRMLALVRTPPARDANVAEILRELSRLAREPAEPPPGPARRTAREPEPEDADQSRKRRFGRGS